MVHRCSYLPLLLPQIRRHFSRWIGRLGSCLDQSQPWFSHEEDGDVPLKWHYPVGLLYDLARARGSAANLPWSLTLHFSPHPSPSPILPFTDPDLTDHPADCTAAQQQSSLPAHFYSSLKQADFLRFGSCRRMMGLARGAQMQLWDALWTHNYDRFWAVNGSLVEDGDSVVGVERAPLRLYLVRSDAPIRILQRPIQMDATLLSGLSPILPTAVKEARIHGLQIPLETPLRWLALNAAYPDNFIHLILIL